MDGILVVDKPGGWTSHDVVARLRRVLCERHVGHAGTLDPAATGVLVVAIGQATRLLEYMADHDKGYLAGIVLGATTETDDAEGRLVARRPVCVDPAAVDAALERFRGPIRQRPPRYSAIKQAGQPLYRLARAGAEVEAPERTVRIHTLVRLESVLPRVELLVECSKGTYIRSLARDLGEVLGTGAYLHDLVRLRSGPFGLEEAYTLAEVEAAAAGGWLPRLVYPPDPALADLPAAILGEAEAARVRHGGRVRLADGSRGGAEAVSGPIALYTEAGVLLGVGEAGAGTVQPRKLLAAPAGGGEG